MHVRRPWAVFWLLAMAPAASFAGEDELVAPQRAEFKSDDGVEIVADFYAPPARRVRAPVAILVHMYPAERSSWRPLVPALHEFGFAVLAYDIRGAGESIRPREKHLRRYYGDRDTSLFANAWQDAAAAAAWLKQRGDCDADRIVMIGASVGCSISLDFAARDKHVLGVVCLSPGTKYMGLASLDHIRKLADRPVLLIAPEEERDAPERLAKAAKKAVVDIRPGGKELHGTHMFSADYGPELIERVARFARKSLDGPEAAADATPGTKQKP